MKFSRLSFLLAMLSHLSLGLRTTLSAERRWLIKLMIWVDFLLLAVQVERCKASERQSKRVVRELKSVLVLFFFLIFLET